MTELLTPTGNVAAQRIAAEALNAAIGSHAEAGVPRPEWVKVKLFRVTRSAHIIEYAAGAVDTVQTSYELVEDGVVTLPKNVEAVETGKFVAGTTRNPGVEEYLAYCRGELDLPESQAWAALLATAKTLRPTDGNTLLTLSRAVQTRLCLRKGACIADDPYALTRARAA